MSIYLKVAMYQWYVLRPLLFGVVIDVVHSEARRSMPSELLYVDDLVLMAPLGRRVTE